MRSQSCSTAPPDEADRLKALSSYGVLDTAPEPVFDEIVALMRRICDAPIALVSLIDKDRQWFKARDGLEAIETPRDISFCTHAVDADSDLLVTDALTDPRFANNPLVTGEPKIRFYAGAVLRSREGMPLGTLCVIDTKPRPEGLDSTQLLAMQVLGRQVMAQLELRRSLMRYGVQEAALDEAVVALADSENRFRAIADSMPQMVWSTLPDGFHDYYNARWYEFTGVPEGSTDGEAWNGMFHPDDQERAWARWRHSLETGDLYEIEYRLRHRSGVYRWTLGRAVPIRNEDGEITRWFGTCTDIDDLKKMEQGKELLSQELSHRIKNIFAVVSALVALSARQYPQAADYSKALRTRIGALARAHEFVRPHSEVSQPTVGPMTLHAFLDSLFRAYADGAGEPRIRVVGDDATFDDQAATSVALLFHELATNAAKYGALSAEGGYVDVMTRAVGERFVLEWRERGGPPVGAPPSSQGFGSHLATVSVEGQLGGKLTREWLAEGLRVVADLPHTALSRRDAARNLQ